MSKHNVNFKVLINKIDSKHVYYTTQAVRGPITKINQSKSSIAVQYSLSIGPDIVCEKPSKLLQLYNKSIINQACSRPYWKNISPRSFLYRPRCAWSILSRRRADILPVRPSRLVNKIDISFKIFFSHF